MNRIKHEDIEPDAFINKLPLSHIQNVRHCSKKVNTNLIKGPLDFGGKVMVGEMVRENELKSGNSTSFSESVSDQTAANRSKNASIDKGFKKKEAHPLSLMVENRFQRASLLPGVFDLKYKMERKVSKESKLNENLEIVKYE